MGVPLNRKMVFQDPPSDSILIGGEGSWSEGDWPLKALVGLCWIRNKPNTLELRFGAFCLDVRTLAFCQQIGFSIKLLKV